MVHSALVEVAHRPWPLPPGPWLLRQVWHDLLFAHWPVPAEILRPLIPAELTIQEWSGTAWLAVTPFWMSGIAFRGLPALPGLSRFDELNVRTYVRLDDRPGVWFFSLDANHRLAILAARRLFGLPYEPARMQHDRDGQGVIFRSRRTDGTRFEACYAPVGDAATSVPGSAEHWLTERYCLYARRGGSLYRADIQHAPWRLQRARVTIAANDMAQVNGIDLQGPPTLLHFSRRLDVVVWAPVPVGPAA